MLVMVASVSKTSQIKKLFGFAWKGLLGLIVIGIAGWYLAVKPILASREKARFEKAFTEIQSLAEQIQEKVGKADSVEESKTCGYSSAKFEKGDLYCTIRKDLTYNVSNSLEASQIMTKSSVLFSGNIVPRSGNTNNESFSDNSKLRQLFSQDLTSIYPVCDVYYSLPATTQSTANSLNISLKCTDTSIRSHYTITNN